jgi:Lar family restriction alleviation protein
MTSKQDAFNSAMAHFRSEEAKGRAVSIVSDKSSYWLGVEDQDGNISKALATYTWDCDPENDILGCPFCDGDDQKLRVRYYVCSTLHYVECNDCDAEGPVFLRAEDAVENWNKAVSND